MKDARIATANTLKVNDEVFFITFDSIFNGTGKLEREIDVVKKIQPTKTGKRVEVFFESGRVVGNIGFNTPMQESSKKYWKELEKERGITW